MGRGTETWTTLAWCAALALACAMPPRADPETATAERESAARLAERERLLWHGERLREAGRHAEAAQAYEQALGLYPSEASLADRSHVLLRLAQSYRSLDAIAQLVALGSRFGGYARVAYAGEALPRDLPFAEAWLPEATPDAPAPITATLPPLAGSAVTAAPPPVDGAPTSSAAFPAEPAPAPLPSVAPAPAPPPPALATTAVSRSPAAADVVLYDDFRGCYRDELGRDVGARGSAWVVIRVGADGAVRDARGASFGLSKPLIDCLLLSAAKARFAPPAGGKAVVAIPISFVRQ